MAMDRGHRIGGGLDGGVGAAHLVMKQSRELCGVALTILTMVVIWLSLTWLGDGFWIGLVTPP